MRKLFSFLLALTASIGMMWAETVEVKLYKSEFTSSGVTKEGVTLALSNGSMTSSDIIAMDGSFEFSTSLGKFTGITIETDANIMQIYENGYTSDGWPTGQNIGTSAAWTGKSETVLISCMVAGMDNITITCTIEPAPVVVTANTLQLHVNDALMGSVAVTNLLGSGIVDNGDGTYDVPDGAEVTLQATPNEGYEFIGWKASSSICEFNECEFVDLHKDDNPLTVDMYMTAAFMAEFAAVAPQPQPAGDGKLTGAFTINADGDQILFSKGNLQYQASTTTWRFATNQYDMIGADNANISDTYTGWIDLFGWGTGDNPAKKSTVDEDYSTFTDWGTNAISNGGNEANLWRTMTIQEWGYLIQTRTNAADLKGQATVADVHGYVFLPDSWTLPAGLSFTASPNNWTTNVYTAEQWAQMEAAGAVFLPATGYREPEIEGVGEKGWYWSSDVYTDIVAYDFEFTETTSRVFGSRIYFGMPVRLVTAAPAVAPTDEQVATNEDPHNPAIYYSTFYHSTQKYQLPNDGTEAYVADLSGTDLLLTKIAEGDDVLPNDVAVILKAPGTTVTLTPTDAAAVAVSAANSLQGVDAETQVADVVTGTCYVLSGNSTNGVGFFKYSASKTLQAHKAYVDVPGSSPAPSLRFVFNAAQNATGVENVSAQIGGSEKVIEDGVLYILHDGVKYNAQGQRSSLR